MTSVDLNVMKALAGTDSNKIGADLNKQVGAHRDVLSKLRSLAGADATAIGNYAKSVDRLAELTTAARADGGELGGTISAAEKLKLEGAATDVEKMAKQDFKVKLEDATTVAAPAQAPAKAADAKAADAKPVDAKAADAKAADAKADPYKTSGGKTYREGPSLADVQSGKKTFTEGDKGAGVKELQTRLGMEPDGFFGPETKKKAEAAGILTKDNGVNRDGLTKLETKAKETAAAAAAKPNGTTAATTVTEGADTRKERLGHADIDGVATRVKDAFAAGGSGQVNSLLGKMNGAELAAVREKIGTKEFEKMIGGIRDVGKHGYDSDYREALQASAFGDRKALKATDVAAFTQQLKEADTAPNIFAQGLKAIGLGGAGTDEVKMNKLFDLDNASLKQVDAELRKSYPGGLREFINSNYGGLNDNSDKTRDLFTKRFDAAGI